MSEGTRERPGAPDSELEEGRAAEADAAAAAPLDESEPGTHPEPEKEPESSEAPADKEAAAATATAAEEEQVGTSASLWADAWKQLRRNPLFIVSAVLIAVFTVMAVFPQLFASGNPDAADLSRSLQRPSSEAWFGFDLQGRDYYTRVIYGARVSMAIGILVVGGSFVIAVVLGSIAGFYGGILDTLIARITDIWFAIPIILAALVMLPALFDDRGLFQVSFVLIVFGWTTMLRLMRSSVLSTKEVEYVDAARTLGAGDFRIITKHILPNSLAPVIVYATIFVGVMISAEAALSFLGVGLQLPAISWGLMISEAQTRLLQAPHLLFFPGFFLSLVVFSFILMGDALRDALDPKLR